MIVLRGAVSIETYIYWVNMDKNGILGPIRVDKTKLDQIIT